MHGKMLKVVECRIGIVLLPRPTLQPSDRRCDGIVVDRFFRITAGLEPAFLDFNKTVSI